MGEANRWRWQMNRCVGPEESEPGVRGAGSRGPVCVSPFPCPRTWVTVMQERGLQEEEEKGRKSWLVFWPWSQSPRPPGFPALRCQEAPELAIRSCEKQGKHAKQR